MAGHARFDGLDSLRRLWSTGDKPTAVVVTLSGYRNARTGVVFAGALPSYCYRRLNGRWARVASPVSVIINGSLVAAGPTRSYSMQAVATTRSQTSRRKVRCNSP